MVKASTSERERRVALSCKDERCTVVFPRDTWGQNEFIRIYFSLRHCSCSFVHFYTIKLRDWQGDFHANLYSFLQLFDAAILVAGGQQPILSVCVNLSGLQSIGLRSYKNIQRKEK